MKKILTERAHEVFECFGGQSKLALALGTTKQAVSLWKGKIPKARAYQIEVITNGRFTAKYLLDEDLVA